MSLKNSKIQKLISSLLILGIFIPSLFFLTTPPKKAEAQGIPILDTLGTVLKTIGNILLGSTGVSSATIASTAVKTWYQAILEKVLKAIARKALQEITKSTVNWINGGFHGSPLFLENSKSFFQDIAKTEVKTLVDTFGYNKLLYPFGKDFAISAINSYKTTLQNNTQYTLSKVINDPILLRNYQNNFNVGGWNGFLINTQYPQNNYLGFQMLATEELARQVQGTVQTAAQKVQTTLQQGNGFLSPQTCPSNPSYNNGINEFQKPNFDSAGFDKNYRKNHTYPEQGDTDNETYAIVVANWESDYAKLKAIQEGNWSDENTCPGGLVATTPGSVVSTQITTALGSYFRQTELGAALGNSLSTIFDALLNKFIGDGLNSLTSKKNPAPVADTWSYDGLTLGSPGDGNDPFGGPDQEIILKDFRILIDGKTIRTFEKGEQLLNENGNPMTYTSDSPIICKDGDKIIDTFTGETIQGCARGETIMCKSGEQIDYSASIPNKSCVGVDDQKQYHTNGERILAEGGEIITFIGDTVEKTSGEYFPGGLRNTITEISLIDNPCDPSDTDCIAKPLDTIINRKTKKIDYIYSPGIQQFVNPVKEATQILDRCVPGPDKGWDFRLTEERGRVERELVSSSTSGDEIDPLKAKGGTDAIKELKFAVNIFKDWIDLQMARSLPGAIIYTDAVKEIDNFAQQTKELIDARRVKVQALARLSTIKIALEKIAKTLKDKVPSLDQPEQGSAEEKEMISLKKQYDATRASISSSVTVENARNLLNMIGEQYNKLTNTSGTCSISTATTSDTCIKAGGLWTASGFIARCTTEREAAGWDIPDKTGRGLSTNGNATEADIFCNYPIISGYSHGDVLRNDEAARYNNCPGDSADACNSAAYDTTGWFTFRNAYARSIVRPPPLVLKPGDPDLGADGYTDLPLVNGEQVYGDKGNAIFIVSVNIDCRTVFKARNSDYLNAGDVNTY